MDEFRQTQQSRPSPGLRKKKKKPPVLMMIIIALIVVPWGLLGYIVLVDDDKSSSVGSSAQTSAQTNGGVKSFANEEELFEYAEERVRGLVLIKSDEEPLRALVVDAERLRSEQAFYKDVQDGHVLLIFADSQKAVIYDVQNDLLVNVGPVFIDPEVDLVE